MLYSLFRLIIVLLICFVICIVIKKSSLFQKYKLKYTKRYKLLIGIIILSIVSFLGTVLYMCPFENLFIDFSSPEDVFKYTTIGDIDRVMYGDKSCMIIYTNNNSKHTLFVRKDVDGYKIVTYPQYSKEHLFSKNYCSTNIYTLTQTKDTYCVGHLMNNTDDINLSDSFDTEYCVLQIDKNVYYFYGYLKNYNENYSLYINSIETVFN